MEGWGCGKVSGGLEEEVDGGGCGWVVGVCVGVWRGARLLVHRPHLRHLVGRQLKGEHLQEALDAKHVMEIGEDKGWDTPD